MEVAVYRSGSGAEVPRWSRASCEWDVSVSGGADARGVECIGGSREYCGEGVDLVGDVDLRPSNGINCTVMLFERFCGDGYGVGQELVYRFALCEVFFAFAAF